MTDTKILFTIIIFIAGFMAISSAFNTNIVEIQSGWNASYYGTNATPLGTDTSGITAPPVCDEPVEDGWIPFIDELSSSALCVGSYIIWLTSLMFFNTTTGWLNALIILPMVAIVGFIIIKLIRGV